MANKKITLKDSTGTDNLYPATFTSQVFDENGNNLDTLLSNLELTAGTGIDITDNVISTTKRILNTTSTNSFSATQSAWTNTGTSLRLPKGKWFIMAEYRITGANADAGINIGWSNTSRETFHPRGYNASWNHPISITAIAEPTSDTNLTCNYFVQNAGTISYVSLTAIEL